MGNGNGVIARGTPAPDFQGIDQAGNRVTLTSFRGRWVVLYFYPKDRTYHCTREACSFRDHHQALEGEGAVVIGVSSDDIESHEDFARRRKLNFPLVADSDHRIQQAYHAERWYGRPRRMTYIIDPDGLVAKVYDHVSVGRHAGDVLSDLRQLKRITDTRVPSRTIVSR